MAKPTSYLSAFLGHPRNLLFLAAATCVAMFASIPYGLPALEIAAVTTLGIEILAALFIPDLPSFRASVDARNRGASRLARQTLLVNQLSQRGENRALETFEHMRSRVNELYQTAGDSSTTLTTQDVDKLADLTVDYLNLCLVNSSLKECRVQASEPDLRKRIAALQDQLSASSLAPDEERQLQKALAEYVETSNRARRLEVRRNSLEATLVGLPDKLEEVYQLVMAAPFSTEMGSKIEESLSRLRIAEEVSAEFNDTDLFSLGPPSSVSSTSTVTPLAAARRNQRAARN